MDTITQSTSQWKVLRESVIKAQYRTACGSWGVMDQPYITVEEVEGSFVITAYSSPHDVAVANMIAGIYDVMEFQIFNDQE
jgi:hypothetical protein